MLRKDFYAKTDTNKIQSAGFYKEKLDFLIKEIGSKKKVLDIGCNDGYVGQKLIERGNEVYGIDISEENVLISRRRGIKSRNVDIENEKLPYRDESFDIVILADIIEHVFDTDMLLRKSARVLKKGGTLIITTPNIASLGRRMMLFLGLAPFVEHSLELSTNGLPSVGHIRYYTVFTLKNQLLHNKFKHISIQGDKINFILFQSEVLGRIIPSFSMMLMGSCKK